MQFLLSAMIVVAMLAIFSMLFFGLIYMEKGDNPQRSNKLMQFVTFMMTYPHS